MRLHFASPRTISLLLVCGEDQKPRDMKKVVSFRMNDVQGLIQPSHHLVFGQWLEIRRFEVQATGGQSRADVGRHQLLIEVRRNGEFMMREAIQLWKILGSSVGVTGVRESSVGIPKLIEEGVYHGIDG